MAPLVAHRAVSQGVRTAHIANTLEGAHKEPSYDQAVDGGHSSLLTLPLVCDDRLVGIAQLRDRVWRRSGREAQSPKCVGWVDSDKAWSRPHTWRTPTPCTFHALHC